jgi:hypothetical protein
MNQYRKIKPYDYMSLFISKENQDLLYEMINKTPEINNVFSTIEEKNRWFKRTIELQYEQLPKNITRETLSLTNRSVLSSMVNYLRSMNRMFSPTPATTPATTPPSMPLMNTLKRDNTPNINQIQSQYNSMFEVPKPKTIDFSEKIDDDVITNMDELIENQKKMRERELQEYSPPPPPPSPTIQQNQSTKINILEDLPKDVLKPMTERRVQFDIPSPSHDSFTQEITKRIDRLEDKIDQFIRLFQTNRITPTEERTEDKLEDKSENISILKQLINQDTEQI